MNYCKGLTKQLKKINKHCMNNIAKSSNKKPDEYQYDSYKIESLIYINKKKRAKFVK